MVDFLSSEVKVVPPDQVIEQTINKDQKGPGV